MKKSYDSSPQTHDSPVWDEQKPTEGAQSSSLALTSSRGISLAVMGSRGLLRALMGSQGLSWALAGSRGLSQALGSSCGLLRAPAGSRGLLRALGGSRGLSRAWFRFKNLCANIAPAHCQPLNLQALPLLTSRALASSREPLNVQALRPRPYMCKQRPSSLPAAKCSSTPPSTRRAPSL